MIDIRDIQITPLDLDQQKLLYENSRLKAANLIMAGLVIVSIALCFAVIAYNNLEQKKDSK